SRSFESFAAWTNRFPSTLTGSGEPERLKAETVSHEFFPLLGVHPALGRIFSSNDDRPGAPPTAILSYSLWQRKFSGDKGILGKTIELNAMAVEGVGGMPAGFRFFSYDTDFLHPFALLLKVSWGDTAGRGVSLLHSR